MKLVFGIGLTIANQLMIGLIIGSWAATWYVVGRNVKSDWLQIKQRHNIGKEERVMESERLRKKKREGRKGGGKKESKRKRDRQTKS